MTVAELKLALDRFPDDLDVRLDWRDGDFEPLESLRLESFPDWDYGEFVCLSESQPRPLVEERPMSPELERLRQNIVTGTLDALGRNLQQVKQINREYDSVMSG